MARGDGSEVARPATPDVKITEALQPVAEPVKIDFKHPGGMGPSPLHGVATALSSLSSDLSAWGAKQEAEQKAEDIARGQLLFFKQNEPGYAEGVASGEIPADKSPWVAEGTARMAGISAGVSADSALGGSFNEWGDKANPDPQAFESWFRENIAKTIPLNASGGFARGLAPQLSQLHEKYHSKWQAEVTKNTQNTMVANYGAALASTVDDMQQDAAQDGELLDTNRLQANMQAIVDHGKAIGLRNDQIDALLINTIQTKALTSRDPSLLSLYDMPSASGAKLGDTPDGMTSKKSATDGLTSLWKTQESEARQEQERQDKLAANQAQQQIIDQLIKDPNAPISDEQLAPALKLNGHFKIDMMEWQKKLREGKVADDPTAVSHLYQDILQGKAGMPEVVAAIQGGQLQTPEGISKAKGFLTSMEDYRKRPEGILDSGMAKSVLGDISRLGQADGITKDLFGKSATTPAGRQAELDFRVGAMQWDKAHPNADPVERDKFLSTFGNSIINGLSAGRDVESGTYVRPQDAATSNDRVLPQPQAAPAATPQAPAPQAQPQAQPQPQAPQPQATPAPWQPSPEQAQRIQQKAQQLGVPPEQIIDSIRQRMQQQAPSVPATPPQAPQKRSDLGSPGAFQMAAINPRAAVEAVRSVAQRLGLGGVMPQAAQQAHGSEGVTPNAYLASRRERFRTELENDPKLLETLAALVHAEGASDPVPVAESLMNRMDMTNRSLRSGMTGAFYGPIRHGYMAEHYAAIRNNPRLKERMVAAIEAALQGSNTINGATDQGMRTDPNGRYQGGLVDRGHGNIFNDWGGGSFAGLSGHAASRAYREMIQAELAKRGDGGARG